MKALSLWQPYATLAVTGVKHYETRGWWTDYRGLLAIHATKKPVKSVIRMLPPEVVGTISRALHGRELLRLPTGAVLGTVYIEDCIEITESFIASLTPRERACGDFTIGRYAWVMEGAHEYERPIPAEGMQRLWNWRGF